MPETWTGETEARVRSTPPAYNRDNPRYTTDLATARTYPYWRDPALPDGWAFLRAEMDPETTIYGYKASYRSPAGGGGRSPDRRGACGGTWLAQKCRLAAERR